MILAIQSEAFELLFRGAEGGEQPAADFPVDREDDVRAFFLGQGFVIDWPGLLEDGASSAHFLPHLFADERGEGSEQQNDFFEDLAAGGGGKGRFVGVELVDEFHEGRDGRIEVPAAFKVLSDLLDGLVELAEHLAVGVAGLAGFVETVDVAGDEAEDAA